MVYRKNADTDRNVTGSARKMGGILRSFLYLSFALLSIGHASSSKHVSGNPKKDKPTKELMIEKDSHQSLLHKYMYLKIQIGFLLKSPRKEQMDDVVHYKPNDTLGAEEDSQWSKLWARDQPKQKCKTCPNRVKKKPPTTRLRRKKFLQSNVVRMG